MKIKEYCKIESGKINSCVKATNKQEAVRKLKEVKGKLYERK